MTTPTEDTDFVDSIRDMLDLDPEQIETLLPKLDALALLDLSDAVMSGDVDAARRIIEPFEQDFDDVESAPDHDDGDDEGDDETADEHPLLSNGDEVEIDGKRGTVVHPKGPSDTVGVKINGKVRMFDRKDVKPVTEDYDMLPNLNRTLQLAGVPTNDALPAVTAFAAPESDIEVDDQETGESNVADQIHSLLDQVQDLMWNATLSDLSEIRKHLGELTQSMNESLQPRQPVKAVRKRKR